MARKTFELTDANGRKSTKNLSDGMTLGDLVNDSQKGLIDGQTSVNSTTLRPGDHVEIIAASGKAGA